MDLDHISPVAPRIGRPAPAPTAEKPFSILGFQPFGDDGPTFHDMLDIVNPLQHLPLISHVYRELTGDAIDPVPRVVGGAIFGGIFGAAASLANVIFEQLTGDDVGGTAIALVKDAIGIDEEGEQSPEMLADANKTTNTTPLPVGEHQDVLTWAERETVWHDAMIAARTITAGGVDFHLGNLAPMQMKQLGLLSPGIAGTPSSLDVIA